MQRVAIVGKRNHLLWTTHLADGFGEQGISPLLFETNVRGVGRSLSRGISHLLGAGKIEADEASAGDLHKALSQFRPQLVVIVGCFFVSLPFWRAISSVKSKPVIVGWDGDNHALHGGETLREHAEHLDLLLTSDRSAIAQIGANFKRTEYLPFAANPKIHRSLGIARNEAFYFCGQRTPHREELLLRGLSSHSLTLCGKRWKGLAAPKTWKVVGKNRAQADMATDLNSHLAGINIHQKEHGSLYPINMRTFEIPGCGALLICDRRGALPELFDEGTEFLAYSTGEELAEVAERSLTNEDTRGIAARAHKRVLAKHTYSHRAREILSLVGEH